MGPQPLDPHQDAPLSWQRLLEEGRVGPALAQARQGDNDPETLRVLHALNDLQGQLRERNYARAKTLLEGLEPIPDLLDWQELNRQLALLEAASERLKPEAPESAIAQLAALDQPVLLAEADTLRGAGHIFLNETEAARSAFERALERDPKHFRAHTNLGNLALEDGRVDEAIAAYERAIALSPDFANAHHNLGVAYRRKGEVGKSVSALRKAQGASQRKLREEARQTLKGSLGGAGRKYGRWLLYGVLAVVVYLLLRSQGVL